MIRPRQARRFAPRPQHPVNPINPINPIKMQTPTDARVQDIGPFPLDRDGEGRCLLTIEPAFNNVEHRVAIENDEGGPRAVADAAHDLDELLG